MCSVLKHNAARSKPKRKSFPITIHSLFALLYIILLSRRNDIPWKGYTHRNKPTRVTCESSLSLSPGVSKTAVRREAALAVASLLNPMDRITGRPHTAANLENFEGAYVRSTRRAAKGWKNELARSLGRWGWEGKREGEAQVIDFPRCAAAIYARGAAHARASRGRARKWQTTRDKCAYGVPAIYLFLLLLLLPLSLSACRTYIALLFLSSAIGFLSRSVALSTLPRGFFSSAPRGAAAAAAVGLCFRILVRGDVCTAWLRRVCSVFFVESHVYARVSFARGGGGSPEAWEWARDEAYFKVFVPLVVPLLIASTAFLSLSFSTAEWARGLFLNGLSFENQSSGRIVIAIIVCFSKQSVWETEYTRRSIYSG